MEGAVRFTVGDQVHVTSLGQGVVREARSGGRYLVELKSHRLLVDGTQLTAVENRKRRTAPKAAAAETASTAPGADATAPSSIDLHGMTTVEAVAALDAFLSQAMLAGHGELRVIHGRSGGRVKAVVHQRLNVVTSVRAFRLDPSNPGVTLVTL